VPFVWLLIQASIPKVGHANKPFSIHLDNEAESEASITSEIERYMANPGQALSYKIGQLKIRELRQRAETAARRRLLILKFFTERYWSRAVFPLQLI